MYLATVPTIVSVLILTLLGYLVIHNQHKLVNSLFVVFIITDSLWLAAVSLVNASPLASNAELSRLTFAASIGLMMAVQAFVNALLQFAHGRLYKWFIYGFGSILLAITAGTDLIVSGVRITHSTAGSSPFPLYGVLYPVFLIYLGPALLIFFSMLIRRSIALHNNKIAKKQISTVSIGLVLFALLSLVTNLILPSLVASAWPSQFAPLGSILLALSFFYAIGRYKLFDIRFFVLRAAAYLASLFIVTLVCIAPVVALFNYLLGANPGLGRFVVTVILSGLVIALLQYARSFFDKGTASLFYRRYYDLQEVLDRLSDVLVHTAEIEEIRSNTAAVLQDALKPEHLSYMLFKDLSEDDSKLVKSIGEYGRTSGLNFIITDELVGEKLHSLSQALRSKGIAIAVRLRTTHEDLGYMVLGYKRSGEAYLERDKKLLSVAADEIAISLQNALRFEEIQDFNVRLQREVEDATRKLRRTNQRLIELDETKDDFISMASHQLRTPLTSVKGYLSMVLEGDAGKLNDTQTKMLSQAFTSSQRMVFLITDLLNVSRLKTGKFVIDPAPVDLSTMIQGEIAQLTETAQAKNLELTYQKPASFPKLMLDETKTRQVIMNFIDNAIYYTPEGGHIRIELTDKPATVELRVVDDGIGVPKGEQHHLFTKFYRAANARKARPDGTGLGLFMAKKVIIAQGGSVLFESKENQGSTFGFVFSKSKLKVTTGTGPEKPAPSEAAKALAAAEV